MRRSPHDFAGTLGRLATAILGHGGTIFAIIDHAANARSAGLSMPPTTVVIFGNPAVGTGAMLTSPDLALDLPSRVLVRQGDDAVELLYTDPAALAERHQLPGDAAAGLFGLTRIIDRALTT